MDGNATFRGRVINGQTSKPVNEAELEAVGEFVIRSYLNVTEKPKTYEDWLQFCNTFSEALPASIGSVKLIPLNTSAE
jgi:hypothetical protein